MNRRDFLKLSAAGGAPLAGKSTVEMKGFAEGHYTEFIHAIRGEGNYFGVNYVICSITLLIFACAVVLFVADVLPMRLVVFSVPLALGWLFLYWLYRKNVFLRV